MKQNFDISKESLIESILSLSIKMGRAKLRINLSVGRLNKIDNFGRVIITKGNSLFDVSLATLMWRDLIVILRYLENMDKCINIVYDKTIYGEIFDLDKKKWSKIPINDDEVRKMIKEFLKTKKNKAYTKNIHES